MKSFSEIHPTLKKISNYRVNALTCNDGFRMSVQASETHYCLPRDNEGPHYKFEVGYPSSEEPALMRYAEDPDRPTDTVYGYVPVEIIDEIIAKHGGIKE